MRRQARRLAAGMVLATVAGGGWTDGCSNEAEDCERSLTCESYRPGKGGDEGGGNPICAADPMVEPGAIVEDCGVFVSASAAPGGDGTKARPFASLQEAMGAAGGKRVYACAEEYLEEAGVVTSGGVEIYGGFTECTNAWSWSATARAVLRGPADAIALTLDGGDNRMVSLEVIAASATAPGGSSIAVVTSGGTLTWSAGAIIAGDAMDGAAGAQLDTDAALDGDVGLSGVGVCASTADNAGPMGKTKMCKTGGASTAGHGGDGGLITMTTALPAGDGGSGQPENVAFPMLGVGGIGEGQGSPSSMVCTSGADGAPGASGMSGAGAPGIGTISASGYTGASGDAGTNGLPGQGGGGGGGAKGGLNINCMGQANRVGASGGAGGTGGCGGTGGGGGQAGGSSIAMVALDAAVTLEGVTLTAGRGGAGGKGGDGQNGGAKGIGGDFGTGSGVAQSSCRGGDGGQGGPGGPGGGGQGGHSLGIAFQGSTTPVGGELVIDPQLAGPGGAGGLNNTTTDGGQGSDGIAAGCWDFASNAACGG